MQQIYWAIGLIAHITLGKPKAMLVKQKKFMKYLFVFLVFFSTFFLTNRLHAQSGGNPLMGLTLEQAVKLALERNQQITQQQIRAEGAAVRTYSIFGTFLPTFSTNAGYNRRLTSGTQYYQGVPIGTSPADNYSIGANINYTIFDGFARSANYNTAQIEEKIIKQNWERTKQDVAHQARIAFVNALRYEQIIETQKNNLELANERLAQIKILVEAGISEQNSILQQELEVVNSEFAIEQAQTDANIAKASLAMIMNYEPNSSIQILAQDNAKTVDSSELVANRANLGSLQDLLKKQNERADLAAARLRLQTNDLAIVSARSARYPTLGAGLNWSWSKNGSLEASNYAALGINAQYNIFDGFRRNEQEANATFQQKVNEIELRTLELKARSDLQQAYLRLEGVERQMVVAQKAVKVALANRTAADDKYKAGATNYTDYLIASNQLMNAQINLLNVVFSYRAAFWEVKYQVGE